MASDLDLIQRCQGGESAAFNELVLRHQDRIYNTALRFAGNAEDAADIAQQAFLNAFRSIREFKGGASFTTWMHRIVFNLFVSSRRKGGKSKTISLDDEESGVVEPSSEESDATEDRRRAVREILDELEDEDRKIIILKDIEGYKYREIADILGIPDGTVHGRIHRIRVTLREKLRAKIGSREK